MEFLSFGYKNAISCIFPVFIFILLGVSKWIGPSLLPRYDMLFLAFILAQAVMYFAGIESKLEVLVITIFHLIGLLLELHKVNVGSWTYPEDAYTKFWGVPLYSGFMYASVASYICRAWDNFDLQMVDWPKKRFAILIGAAIYLNFFTNAYIYDMRWIILAVLLVVFRKTKVNFNTNGNIRQMPLLLAFLLIGFFLWLAENIATYLGAWKYAYQHKAWAMVEYQKIVSWSLLIIVSIIIVAQLKHFRPVLVSFSRTQT